MSKIGKLMPLRRAAACALAALCLPLAGCTAPVHSELPAAEPDVTVSATAAPVPDASMAATAATAARTAAPSPTVSPTQTPQAAPSPTPSTSPSPAPSPSPMLSLAPSLAPSPTPSPTPSSEAVAAISPLPEASATPLPEAEACFAGTGELTATPSPEATAAPSPTAPPTQAAPSVSYAAESGYDSYFNDAVFVGDSITQSLQLFISNRRSYGETPLGSAQFYAAQSFSLYSASNGGRMKVDGVSMTVPEAVTKSGAAKVFFLLGVNDGTSNSPETYAAEYRAVFTAILDANPDVELFVQSLTPITAKGEKKSLNNAGTDAINEALKALCDELGLDFIDINTPLKNTSGVLDASYSSDNYVHLNYSGAKIWVETLRTFAESKGG